MGSVTATVSNTMGEMYSSESLHFESYEDFLNYESIKSPVDFGCSKEENKNNIYLTDKQAYKLRIILGHVLKDKDCAHINEQLDCLYDNELECEDYDKLFFTFMQGDGRVVLADDDKEATIQFK